MTSLIQHTTIDICVSVNNTLMWP